MASHFRAIAEFMDPVQPPSRLSTLMAMHQLNGSNLSFREICRRHNHPHRRTQLFMFLNTFLMDVFLDDIVGGAGEVTKPAINARCREIGQFICDHIDIAALAEVWKEREKDRILAQWPSDRKPFTADMIARIVARSAGLLTLSQSLRITGSRRHEYRAESSPDALASKGVLLTIIDVGSGPSLLEVYSTHLNAGADARDTRYRQLGELHDFVTETHSPANPALIVGDFNIKAHSDEVVNPQDLADRMARWQGRSTSFTEALKAESSAISDYDVLKTAMATLGFRDLWTWRNGTPGYTSAMERPDVAARICAPDRDPRYCDDLAVRPAPPSDRLDYIFGNQTVETQSFTLDFTRPRRLRLSRDPSAHEFDKIAFMSDHVGLETTLLITPGG